MLATWGASSGFNVASLFAAGEQGAWYDPSDNTTMFTTSAGTTQVTAVETAVGLILDKSKGLVLGPELVDTANTASAWTALGTNTVTQDGDAVSVTYVDNSAGAYIYLTQAGGLSVNLTANKSYTLTYQIKINSGSANFALYATALGNFIDTNAVTSSVYVTRSVTFLFVSGSPYIQFANLSAGESISIRNISVKELPGNHAYQSTDASRPILRSRYNLLEYSEQFDNAYWTKNNLNTTGTPAWVNVAVAPDGTTTADFIIPDATTSGTHRFQKLQTVPLTGTYVLSVYVKSSGTTSFPFVKLRLGSAYANFNVATGAAGLTNATSATQSVGNGWFRVSLTFAATTNDSTWIYAAPTDNAALDALSAAGDGTGFYVWGAQLTQTAVFPSNTYQRIAAATDYATGAAFPQYLAFDGTDDSLLTASVDFTGTDKVTVWAGVSKLSDAATGTVIDLNGVAGTGSFMVRAPQATAANYSYYSGGSVGFVGAISPSSYASPITNVLTGQSDIASDLCILRINAVEAANATSNQGSGNYSNLPLYIGRRQGSALPFNGRIYSLIVRGAASSTSQITQTERYVAAKTPLGVVP